MHRRRAARLRRLWWAWLAALADAAHGGPAIGAALARDQALAEQRPWWGLAASQGAPALTLGWGERRDDLPALIGQDFAARGGALWLLPPARQGRIDAQFGVAWRAGRTPAFVLEGSSAGWTPIGPPGSGEFYASVQRRHWGPGWIASLILDGAAPPIPAVGWRRTEVRRSENLWTSWLGPWGADIFVGRLQGHRQPERPTFIGMRSLLAPTPWLEAGFSRTLQWGGRGRDERWSSLRNALLGNDNVGFGGISAENEPGNQLAGIDLRLTLDAATQTAIYGQVIGEDEAGKMPTRNMVLIGADTRWAEGGRSMRLFVEGADVLAGRISRDPRPTAAYRHPVYPQGYTQDGKPIGHPVGGDLKLGSVGGIYRVGPASMMAVVSIGRAEPTAQRFTAGRVFGADAALQFEADTTSKLHAGFTWWSDNAGRRRAARVGWQLGW